MTYHHWTEPLSPDVELWHVTLPGRGGRWCEPPAHEWSSLVDELAIAIAALVRPPLTLCGHSVGGLLAFEVARRLEARGVAAQRLIVVATRPPTMSSVLEFPEGDAKLVQLVTLLGGVAPSVYAASDVVAQYLPLLRADLELVRRYRRLPGPPLACPITVVACHDDDIAPPREMDGWAAESTVDAQLRLLPGGHFLGPAEERALLAEILGGAAA